MSYIAGALGVCVAAVYYVINLRISQKNQELMLKSQESSVKTQELALKAQQQAAETRQAQLFMQVFGRFHDQEFWRNYTTISRKKWKTYDDFSRGWSDPDLAAMTLSVNTYFEGIGVLVRRGLLSPELVSDLLSGPLVIWWNYQAEFIKEYRVRTNWPQSVEGMEYLYNEVMKVRSASYSPKVDRESIQSKSQE